MKKIMLGVLLGYLTFPLLCDVANLATYYGLKWETPTYVSLGGYNAFDLIKKNCTKDVLKNGHGWVFIARKYHECNALEIALSDMVYGEYTDNHRKL